MSADIALRAEKALCHRLAQQKERHVASRHAVDFGSYLAG
jgi:hypothetical protein